MYENLRKSIELFFVTQYLGWKEQFVYRLQAITYLLYSNVYLVVSIAAITFIYAVTSGIPGWSYYQMLFLTGASAFVFGALAYLIEPVALVRLLTTGGLDAYMSRPYNTLLLYPTVIGDKFSITVLINGTILMLYSAYVMGLGYANLLAAFVLMLLGIAVLWVLLVLSAVLTSIIRAFQGEGWHLYSFRGMLGTAGNYPTNQYGPWGQFIFTFLLPVALAIFYPARVAFGTINPFIYLALIAMAIAAIAIFWVIAKSAMKRNQSGGG